MKGHFQGGYQGKGKSQGANKNKQVEVNFFLIDSSEVGIQIPYGYCFQQIKNLIRDIGQGSWNFDDKYWRINRTTYPTLLQKIQDYFFAYNQKQSNQKIIKVNAIEDFVFKAQKLLQQELTEINLINLKPYTNIQLKYNSVETNIDPQSLPFYKKLFDFQKESLKFGIKKHGRMLLADEMGVGKTIQSLAVAYIYKHEWPLLIICPPTLKINWQNEIKRWYPDIQPTSIQLINSKKTAFRVNVSILIVSYDLAWRMKQMFDHIKIVIADQAHYLKSADSKRSEVLVPFLSTRKRVMLLTGTPAFARPRQIYNLITIIRPNLYKNFKMFGNRYCDPKWNHWSHTYQYNGCKNVKQLHYILKNNIMIRRLKSQVLTELPDKNRQKITLETDASIVKEIKGVLAQNNIDKMETFFSEFVNQANSFEDQHSNKKAQIMQAYRLSGMAKVKAVREYIDQILENNIKILVFAHHQKVMDQIEAQLKSKKHKFMRIDGNVSQTERANNVQKFQNDPQILVALLSITAAGVGITLTAASTVIFAELHWTPALMIQAEDRAHRVGQKDSVNCHYLIGQNTLDQMLYKFLQKKVLNVTSFVDGHKKDLDFQELQKGQKGKFSKKQQILIKKMSFGSNLMPEIVYENNMDISQHTQVTDISISTIAPPKVSRKRNPGNNLDYFLLPNPKVVNKQISEMSELKYVQSEKKQRKIRKVSDNFEDNFEDNFKDNFEDNFEDRDQKIDKEYKYQNRKTFEYNDYWQTKQKVEQKQEIIDSDQEFQKALQYYAKAKTASNPNSSNSKQQINTQSPVPANKFFQKEQFSQTQSVGSRNNRSNQDIEI